MTDIARLRVEVDDTEPKVVRHIEVPLSIRLDDLHFVLQVAIGWQNCHPFEFRSGEAVWGLVDKDDPDSSPLAAETATLADLMARGPTFQYGYVYGDDWQHTVSVEDTEVADADVRYPRLVNAEGACPPADIGPDGYEEYLRARADPEHLHHEGLWELDDAANSIRARSTPGRSGAIWQTLPAILAAGRCEGQYRQLANSMPG